MCSATPRSLCLIGCRQRLRLANSSTAPAIRTLHSDVLRRPTGFRPKSIKRLPNFSIPRSCQSRSKRPREGLPPNMRTRPRPGVTRPTSLSLSWDLHARHDFVERSAQAIRERSGPESCARFRVRSDSRSSAISAVNGSLTGTRTLRGMGRELCSEARKIGVGSRRIVDKLPLNLIRLHHRRPLPQRASNLVPSRRSRHRRFQCTLYFPRRCLDHGFAQLRACGSPDRAARTVWAGHSNLKILDVSSTSWLPNRTRTFAELSISWS